MSSKDLRQNQNTVWEEAGAEFYQENYNKSGRINSGTMARISLPSHTARRNSGWKTTTYTHRQSTNCGGGNEYIIDGIPDLADELPNEKSTFEQLESFKGTPVSMAEKRGLKTQLITNPILKLNGWGGLKWRMEKSLTNFCRIRKHFNYTLFHGHLKSVENRFGFIFTTFFQDIKILLFLNLITILPFVTCYLYNQVSGMDVDFFKYDNFLAMANSTDRLAINMDNITDLVVNSKSFLYYGYYETNGGLLLLLVATYFGLTLVYYLAQIWICLSEKIESKHVKHVYTDLIFCRMDHFTKCKTGAAFKRRAIQKEIRGFVQNIIIEGNESNRLGIIGIRTCVNLIVVGLISLCVAFNNLAQDFSHNFNFAESKFDPIEIFVYGLPQILICLTWPIMSFFVERMGKWEKYTYNTRIFILVIRCWIIRVIFMGGFILKFYQLFYANSQPKNPTIILKTNPIANQEEQSASSPGRCWESDFAKEIYKFLIVEMILKVLIIFMFEPIRALMRRLLPSIIGAVHFHIVWNYLDILTIQALSWIGIYFSPVLPIAICIYSFFLFFIKTFSLLANCSGSPDLYRQIKSLMVKIKILTFMLSILVMVVVIGWLKPSTDCGPFKDYGTPWDFLLLTIRENINTDFLSHFKCPQWSLPLMIIFLCLTVYYKFVVNDGEKMIQTLRHLLVLEGHDKQWLFRRVEAMQTATTTTA